MAATLATVSMDAAEAVARWVVAVWAGVQAIAAGGRDHPLLAMAAVAVALGAAGGVIALLCRVPPLCLPGPNGDEMRRKAIHVLLGSVTLTFPLWFDRAWPVQALAVGAAALLLLLRVERLREGPLGRILHRVERVSFGDLFFPLAVGLLFTLTRPWESREATVLYAVPLLLLTVSDAAAALIGRRYGSGTLTTGEGAKSPEGAAAFLFSAFLAVHLPLLLSGVVGPGASVLIALTLAVLATQIELFSWRGLDNLFLPVGAWALLSLYLPLGPVELSFRFVAAVALLAAFAAARGRSRLDHAALAAAALFGYLALMVGGLAWTVPPLLVFALPAIAFPHRDRSESAYRHTPALAGIVALGGVCLIARTWDWQGAMPHLPWGRLYAFVFAVHLGCVLARYAQGTRGRVVAVALAAAATLACVPLCEPTAPPAVAALAAAIAALAAGAFAASLPALRARTGPDPAPTLWLANALALLGSVAVVAFAE